MCENLRWSGVHLWLIWHGMTLFLRIHANFSMLKAPAWQDGQTHDGWLAQMYNKKVCLGKLKKAMTTPGYRYRYRYDAQFTAMLQRSTRHNQMASCRWLFPTGLQILARCSRIVLYREKKLQMVVPDRGSKMISKRVLCTCGLTIIHQL